MRVLHWLVLALAVPAGSPATAQTAYPDRPIKMIVPLAAASAVDVAARIVTQKMANNMGQQFVIMNLPGASGLIGAEQVARAEPDGYTIGGFNDSIMTMVPNLQSKMRWDILKDFEPVSLVATVEWGLIANNRAPYKSAADLIAAARAAPGKIDYGSGGPGSPQHLAMAMFASAAGISLTHVPYKGATQAATDIAAGQIPVGFQGLGTVAALVRGGQLRLIGVTTQSRLSQFPDVPTVSESGLPGVLLQFLVYGHGAGRDAERHHRQAECRNRQSSRRSRDWSQARGPGFCGARQLSRGAARHDTRSACQICPAN
jgi:tripartite-type tricarboxylate transporter receptor subunit TctC